MTLTWTRIQVVAWGDKSPPVSATMWFLISSGIFGVVYVFLFRWLMLRKTRTMAETVVSRGLTFATLTLPSQQFMFLFDTISELNGRRLHEKLISEYSSILGTLTEWETQTRAAELAASAGEAQSGPLGDHNFEKYWKALRGSELLSRMRRFIASCLVSSDAAETLKMNHRLFYKRLFKGVDTVALDPLDIMDEFIALAQLVTDMGVDAYSGGSSFLFGKEMVCIEEELASIKALENIFLRGDLVDYTTRMGETMVDQAYVSKCELLEKRISRALRTSDGFTREALGRRYETIKNILTSANDYMSTVSTKEPPLLIVFYGTAGSGKTNVLSKYMIDFQRWRKRTDNYIRTVNAADRFLSGVTNSDRIFLFDDFNVSNPEYTQDNPLAFLLTTCSSVRAPILSAEAHMKGKIRPAPELIGISANEGDMGADTYATCPAAVMRRCDLLVRVDSHPLYRDGSSHMVDGSKVPWGIIASTFTVYKVVVNPPKEAVNTELKPDNGYSVRILNFSDDHPNEQLRGKPMEGISYLQLVQGTFDSMDAKHSRGVAHAARLRADATAPFCHECMTTVDFCAHSHEDTESQSGPKIAFGEWIEAIFLPRAGSTPSGPMDIPSSPVSGVGLGDSSGDEFDVHDFASADVDERRPSWMTRSWRKLSSAWSVSVRSSRTFALPILGFANVAERLVISNPEIAYVSATYAGWIGNVSTSLILLACGAGTFGCILWAGVFQLLFSAASVRIARAWVSGRIAGAPLDDIKRHCKHMALTAAGITGFAFIVYMIVVLVARMFRPRALRAGERAAMAVINDTPDTSDGERVGDALVDIQPQPAGTAHGGLVLPASVPSTTAIQSPVPPISGSTAQADVAIHPLPSRVEDAWNKRPVISEGLATIGMSMSSYKTATQAQHLERIKNALARVDVTYSDGQQATYNAFSVATNHTVEPAHVHIHEGSGLALDITSRRYSFYGPKGGATFNGYIGPSQVVQLGVTEVAAVQTATGGTRRDLTPYFADSFPTDGVPCLFLYRDESYTVQVHKVVARPLSFDTDSVVFKGRVWETMLPFDTFKGLCGALLVSNTRIPVVLGMHVRGFRANSRRSLCAQVCAADVLSGLRILSETAIVRGTIVGEARMLNDRGRGVKLGELSPASIFRELGPETGLRYIGSTDLPRNRPRSSIVTAPWSNLVADVTGVPREHGSPITYGHARNIKQKYQTIGTAGQFDAAVLELAVADLTAEIVACFRDYEFEDAVKIYDYDTCLNGGSGIKRVNVKTAVGWPDTGSKLQVLDVDICPDGTPHISMKPEFAARVAVGASDLESGIRAGFILKASQKDESIKLGKLKTRVFEGGQFELLLLGRRYFGFMEAAYRALPLEMETAVGLNALGTDWDRMEKWFNEYHPTHRIQEDFPSYDDNQTYVLQSVATRAWLNAMRELKASLEHLRGGESFLEEVKRAYVSVNEDIVGKEGGWGSGVYPTIDVNNVIHATYDRVGFYSRALKDLRVGREWPEVPLYENPATSFRGYTRTETNHRAGFKPLLANLHGRFKDYVRTVYVGDDGNSAVRIEAESYFNNIIKAEELAEGGIHVTNPQKTGEIERLIPVEKSEFLKRTTRWDADLGMFVGPLRISSIFKSLHTTTRKRVDPDDVHLAGLIDGAVHELFLHGREVFEDMVPRLSQVAEKAGAKPFLSPKFTCSWDEYRQHTAFAPDEGSGSFGEDQPLTDEEVGSE